MAELFNSAKFFRELRLAVSIEKDGSAITAHATDEFMGYTNL